MSTRTLCDWCEQSIENGDRPVRLNNGSRLGMYDPDPVISVVFHRECWEELAELLRGAKPRPAEVAVLRFGSFRLMAARRA